MEEFTRQIFLSTLTKKIFIQDNIDIDEAYEMIPKNENGLTSFVEI